MPVCVWKPTGRCRCRTRSRRRKKAGVCVKAAWWWPFMTEICHHKTDLSLRNPEVHYRTYISPPLVRTGARSIQSPASQATSFKSILISSNLRRGLPKGLFTPGLPTKVFMHFWITPYVVVFNDGYVQQLWSETVAVRDGWYMVLDDIWLPYDNRDECGPNILIFVLRLRDNPGKTSSRKLTRPGIEPGPAAWEVTMLPVDHSGGQLHACYMSCPCQSSRFKIPNY